MSSLLDATALAPQADTVLSELKPESVVVVGGPEGAGRGHVLAHIHATLRTLEIEAPPLSDPDAGVHLLLQLIAHVPSGERDALLAGRSLQQNAREATRAAVESKNAEVLALRLPRSWERLIETRDDEDERQVDRVREVLRGIQDYTGVALLVFCGTGRHDWRRWLRSPTFVPLGPAQAQLDRLEDSASWGNYSQHALRVLAACKNSSATPTPLQARLLVALTVLGADASTAVDNLEHAPRAALLPLLRELKRRFALPEHGALHAGVQRLLVARRPVASGLLDQLTNLPDHASFFSECIGYTTPDGVRVTEVIRDELRSVVELDVTEPAHEKLLGHYKTLDGVSHPRDVAGVGAMRAWLERAHHAAELRDATEWEQLDPPCPEFFWSRARWLSRVCHDYCEAARVYRAGVEKFPNDDYGWHYLGWNLERASGTTPDIDSAFRRAITIDETNRWWNSRYVTFLIGRALYDRAEAEYHESLDRLRTSGTEKDLAPSFHRWIVRAWLESGEVVRARSVFEDIPDEARDDPRIVREYERLLDAEEAEALGASVYPAGQRISKRWVRPSVLPEHVDHVALSHWYPAYVEEVTSGSVTLVLAEPNRSAENRRVFRRELTLDDWARSTDSLAPKRSQWLYVGRYGEDRTRIVLNPASMEPPSWLEDTSLEVSSYLQAWHHGTSAA